MRVPRRRFLEISQPIATKRKSSVGLGQLHPEKPQQRNLRETFGRLSDPQCLTGSSGIQVGEVQSLSQGSKKSGNFSETSNFISISIQLSVNWNPTFEKHPTSTQEPSTYHQLSKIHLKYQPNILKKKLALIDNDLPWLLFQLGKTWHLKVTEVGVSMTHPWQAEHISLQFDIEPENELLEKETYEMETYHFHSISFIFQLFWFHVTWEL